MAGSIWDWSQTAADNDDADAEIEWRENMAAREVNNSARAMMRRIAQVLSDISAQAASGGSANAYTLTTVSPFTSYVNGTVVGFTANFTNTSTATLNTNALGAKAIYAHGVALRGGEIVSGGAYILSYDTALNGAAGGWHLLTPTPITHAVYLRKISSGELSFADTSSVVATGDPADAAANTTGIQNLITSFPSWGGRLTIPPGNWPVAAGSITLSDKNITVDGAGPNVSRLLVTGAAGNLFTITQSSQNYKTTFRDFSADKHTDASTTGALIRCNYPSVSSSLTDTILVERVHCAGATGTTQFAALLAAQDAWHVRATDLVFSGTTSAFTASGAVVLLQKCSVAMVQGVKAYWANSLMSCDTGYLSEGFYMTNCHAVATNYLGYFPDSIAAPGLQVTACHGETMIGGIYAINRTQVMVENSLFYKRLTSTSDWSAIWVEGTGLYDANTASLNNNQIFGFKGSTAGGTATGIVMSKSDVSSGTGNIIRDCDLGVDLLSNSNAYLEFAYNNVTTPSTGVPAGATVTATSLATP
jgi:hypothetical protein